MTQTLHGRIEGGQIVLDQPLTLADGSQVVVSISEVAKPELPTSTEEFLAQPFFGMWKDREDMKDSAAWVRKEREKWRDRPYRQD